MSTIAAYPGVFLGPAPAHRESAIAFDRRYEEAVARPVAVTRKAVLVGNTDPHVRSLLADVLRDINIDVEVGDAQTSSADAVLAMVERVEGIHAITDAKARFGHAPIVAILPLGTHRLATRAIAAGAQACYLLDMPIDRLRGLLVALLKAPLVDDKRRASRSAKAR